MDNISERMQVGCADVVVNTNDIFMAETCTSYIHEKPGGLIAVPTSDITRTVRIPPIPICHISQMIFRPIDGGVSTERNARHHDVSEKYD